MAIHFWAAHCPLPTVHCPLPLSSQILVYVYTMEGREKGALEALWFRSELFGWVAWLIYHSAPNPTFCSKIERIFWFSCSKKFTNSSEIRIFSNYGKHQHDRIEFSFDERSMFCLARISIRIRRPRINNEFHVRIALLKWPDYLFLIISSRFRSAKSTVLFTPITRFLL